MPPRSTHHDKTTISTSGSGLMSPSMALSESHHAAGNWSGSSLAARIDDDIEIDGPKRRTIEVLGAREEAHRREWEDSMQAIAASLAADYPLLDLPLILSLISDLNPAELASSKSSDTALQDIRETLAILQAGMVPDDDGYVDAQRQSVSPPLTHDMSTSDVAPVPSIKSGSADANEKISQSSSTSSLSVGSRKDTATDDGRPSTAAIGPSSGIPGILAVSSIMRGGSSHVLSVDGTTIEEDDSHLGRILEGLRVEEDGAHSDPEQNMDVFLMEMFEYLPHSTIVDAITRATSPSGQIDVVRAIDDLVSQERIRDVYERGGWDDTLDGANDGSTDEDDDQDHPLEIITPRRSSGTTAPVVPSPTTPKINLITPNYSRLAGHSKSLSHSDKSHSSPTSLAPRPVQIIKRETVGTRYSTIASDRTSNASTSSASEDESGSETASIRSQRRQGKARPTPLVDTLQRRDSNAPTTPKMHKNMVVRPSTPPFTSQPSSNAWHTIVSLASALENLLNQQNPKATSAHFIGYFHSGSYISGYAAMKAALEALMVPRAAVENALLMAAEIMGVSEADNIELTSINARRDLQVCVRASRGDVGVALDLCTLLQEVRSWQSEGGKDWAESLAPSPNTESDDIPKPSARHFAAAKALPAFPPSPRRAEHLEKARRKVEHPQNWRTVTKAKTKKRTVDHPLAEFIPSYSRGATPHDATPGSLFSDPSDRLALQSIYDLNVCRRRAAEERRKREDAMRQAGKYFKVSTKTNGVGSGKEVASFYAAEARRYEQEARMWELRAAREVVKKQSAHHDKFCIDIHHLTLAEATTVVLESVAEWHASQHFVPSPAKPFQVITGVGKHSPNHVGVLLPAITNVLQRNGWKVDRGYSGRGYILVRGVAGA